VSWVNHWNEYNWNAAEQGLAVPREDPWKTPTRRPLEDPHEKTPGRPPQEDPWKTPTRKPLSVVLIEPGLGLALWGRRSVPVVIFISMEWMQIGY
jgi:hypothetical protein